MRQTSRLVLLGCALSVIAGLAGCGKVASLTAPTGSVVDSAPPPPIGPGINPPLGLPADPSAQ